MPTTIVIRPDGAIESLHDESLRLDRLGHRRIRRASHVEFDEDRQVWAVEVAETGERIFEHMRRSACLDFEKRYFNDRLARGLSPFGVA